jgi:hypothetical protein
LNEKEDTTIVDMKDNIITTKELSLVSSDLDIDTDDTDISTKKTQKDGIVEEDRSGITTETVLSLTESLSGIEHDDQDKIKKNETSHLSHHEKQQHPKEENSSHASLDGLSMPSLQRVVERGTRTRQPGAIAVRPPQDVVDDEDFDDLDDDESIQRHPSSMYMTPLDATLVMDDAEQNKGGDASMDSIPQSAFVVTAAIPIDNAILQELNEMDEQSKDDFTISKQNNRRNRIRLLLTLFLILIALLIAVVIVVLFISQSKTDTNNIGGRNSTNSTTTTRTYNGNWLVKDYTQITKHMMMTYIRTKCYNDDDDNTDTESILNFNYVIQCGTNMTTMDNDDSVKQQQQPMAAIEFITSSQTGTCTRTQVNVLSCTTRFVGNTTKLGTLFTCGFRADFNNQEIDMNELPSPVVTINTDPIVTSDPSCHGKIVNSSVTDRTTTNWVVNEDDVRSITNIVWMSLNRFCYIENDIRDVIQSPTNCVQNSNHATFGSIRYAANWSYCLSSSTTTLPSLSKEQSVIAQDYNSDDSVVIVPSMMIMDEYNATIIETSCPYYIEYDMSDVPGYFAEARGILDRLTSS